MKRERASMHWRTEALSSINSPNWTPTMAHLSRRSKGTKKGKSKTLLTSRLRREALSLTN